MRLVQVAYATVALAAQRNADPIYKRQWIMWLTYHRPSILAIPDTLRQWHSDSGGSVACPPPQQVVTLNGVTVGSNVSVGENVSVGKGTVIEPGVVIHQGVEIGRNCRIAANAVLSHCRLGDKVWIGANNVIGASGFGFEITDEGPVLVEHVGSVEIGRSSRTGAGCTIDRGTLGRTQIGESVMIDNLVHIAHNCIIGDRAVLAAQAGLAGGAIIGEGAILAGQAGVGSQVTVGKGAIVMGQSGVTKDVPDHTTVVGFPAEETRKVWRERVALRRLLGSSRNEEK